MAADTLKSNSITDLDGGTSSITVNGVSYVVNNGIVFPNPNDYGPGGAFTQADFVTPTTGGLVSTSSVYKMLRLPSTASLRALQLRAGARLDTGGASATLTVDVGLYYSDSLTDSGPTDQLNIGAVISANCLLAAHSFGTTLDKVTAGVGILGDLIIDAMGSVNANLIGSPLWLVGGLSTDPGGFLDIAVAVHAAANTAVATPFALIVDYNK